MPPTLPAFRLSVNHSVLRKFKLLGGKMPICEGCSSSYDEKYKFCPFCGRAAPQPASNNVLSADEWEFCEIELFFVKQPSMLNDFLTSTNRVFHAVQVTDQGRVSAGHSEELIAPIPLIKGSGLSPFTWHIKPDFQGYEKPVFQQGAYTKHDNFVKSLCSDGWQYVGKGNEWYNMKFRRRVTKK
jgi:hypothetical protein